MKSPCGMGFKRSSCSTVKALSMTLVLAKPRKRTRDACESSATFRDLVGVLVVGESGGDLLLLLSPPVCMTTAVLFFPRSGRASDLRSTHGSSLLIVVPSTQSASLMTGRVLPIHAGDRTGFDMACRWSEERQGASPGANNVLSNLP